MEWTWLAAPSILALVVSWALAALVVWSRPHASPNRRLALLLVIEGIVIFGLNGGGFLFEDARVVYWLFGLGTIAVGVKPSAYLHFLATLDSPLVQPLRTRPARMLLVAAAVASASLWFLAPQIFLTRLVPTSFAAWAPQPGSLLRPLAVALSALYLGGLVFAHSARRQARSPAAKARTRAYFLAFLVRDVAFAAWAVAFVATPFGHALWPYVYVGVAFMPLAFAPLVVYGMLRAQLFDIDLRVKWTISRATLMGVFLAVFFVVTVTAENFLTDRYGWAVGGVGAGLLLFALAPLRRLADRVSDSAMPDVRDTPAYRDGRKVEVYRATLEEILADGHVTLKERRALMRLQQALGLDAAAAGQLELTVMEGMLPASRPNLS